jgi:hypothetical protein
MLNKLLRAVAITAILSVLMYGGFIDAKAAHLTAKQTLPPVALKLTFP